MHKMYSCLFVLNFSTVLASTAGRCKRAALSGRLAFLWHSQDTEGASSTQHLNLYFHRDLQLKSGAGAQGEEERVGWPGFPYRGESCYCYCIYSSQTSHFCCMESVLLLRCCCVSPALSQAEHGPGASHAQISGTFCAQIPQENLTLCAKPALLCPAAPPRAGHKALLCISPVTPWAGDTSRNKAVLLPGATC